MQYNKVIIAGNLTRDPELRTTPSGSSVCELGLATNRKYTTADGQQQEDVCFVDVEVWGRQAENCGTYLQKGQNVLVEGRLQMDQWQDRQTGQNRSKLKINASAVQFGQRPGGAGYGQPQGSAYGQQPRPAAGGYGGGAQPPPQGDTRRRKTPPGSDPPPFPVGGQHAGAGAPGGGTAANSPAYGPQVVPGEPDEPDDIPF